MTEARSHEPKLSALRAHCEARLSTRGRLRLERHLEQCAACREQLEGMRRFRALQARSEPRVERAIDGGQERALVARALARADATTRRRLVFGGAIALAAAAVVLLWLQPEPAPPLQATAPRAPATPVAPAWTPLALTITALAGDVRGALAGEALVPIDLRASLREGFELDLGPQAELHVTLGEAGALRAVGGSRLRIERARSNAVELVLERGELIHRVAPRKPGEPFLVHAGGYRVEVVGTLFSVQSSARGELSVRCDEGKVIVRDAALAVVAELSAPASWHVGAATSPSRRAKLSPPWELPARGDAKAAVLVLPEGPRSVSGWELQGVPLSSAAELELRAPPGALSLTALLRDGRRVPIGVKLDPLGTRFDPAALALQLRQDSEIPATVAAAADAGSASDVIRRGTPQLQRCYERSLKNEAEGGLTLELEITLDARGRVRRVAPQSERELPPGFEACLSRAVKAWAFPAPGEGGATLRAPLKFRLRR